MSWPEEIDKPVTRLKGELHSSRGQRPRRGPNKEVCPVRANQNPSFSKCHATIIAHPERAHHFFHQREATLVSERHSSASLGLSVSYTPNHGMPFDHSRRRRRSCACPLQSFEKVCSHENSRIAQKRFFKVYKNAWSKFCGFSLAGRLWAFQHKPFALPSSARIHFESRNASQERNVSGGASAHSQKIPRGIRRALLVGLRRLWIALSGQNNSLARSPRALPSATMVQTFGLHSLHQGLLCFFSFNSRFQVY